MSVCKTMTFESLDVKSSLLVCGDISSEYESSSHMKVIGSRSRSQEQNSEIPYSRKVKLQSTILRFL